MNFVKRRRTPELLAPAGSFEHLKAAVHAGADAIYMGGEKFGARAYAHNFSREDMIEALKFAHFHERKLYMTVNTLMKESEISEELGDFLLPYYEHGLDGVIVQDFGAVRFIRENFPGMEIHGSTQMTVTDFHGAVAAKRMGLSRVVPARELSLPEIKRIKEETGLEVEVFVHGALCYCYSGQCLLSSLYGGRSGNRGRCAQPCRLAYQLEDSAGNRLEHKEKGKYLLSPKDLCSLSMLPELMELPVDSLKIEGRMKNVEYVAGVTSIYRKYLDELAANWKQREQFSPKEEDIHALEELYCRGSFTQGYWKKHNGQDMMSPVSPKNTGRKIGKVISVSKNKVKISLEDVLHPKDILVIPVSADRQEELVLTVPSKCQEEGGKSGQITLNAPRTQSLKAGMSVYRRKNMELSAHIEKNILNKVIKYPVTGDITLKVGEPLMLELFCRDECAFVEGPIVEASEKRPVAREDILRQMNKTGNVPFTLTDFEVNMEENCFLPMSVLKNMRQQAFALLEDLLKKKNERISQVEEGDYTYLSNSLKGNDKNVAEIKQEAGSLSANVVTDNTTFADSDVSTDNNISDVSAISSEGSLPSDSLPEKIATVYNKEQAALYGADTFFDGICLPYEFFAPEEVLKIAQDIKNAGKKVYFCMLRVFRASKTLEDLKTVCLSPLWDGIYVYTMNEAEFLNQAGCKTPIVAGASFYHWNGNVFKETQELYPQMTMRELPVELSKKEAKEMLLALDKAGQKEVFFEVLVYGRIPVMQSAQCLKKTTGRCNKIPEQLYLQDKKGRKLPITTHCRDCYNLIWQDVPMNLIGEDLEGFSSHVKRHRFDLFLLNEAEVETRKREYLDWSRQHFTDRNKEEKEHHWNYGIE